MKNVLLLFALLFASSQSASAALNRVLHIDSRDGLPHQQVSSIVEDGDGYIWIGTRNGLVRYDGYDIKTYYHTPSNPHSLVHNFVSKLFVDSKRRLWVLTESGVCRYRDTTDDFRVYSSPDEIMSSIVETSHSKIIIGGGRLYSYDEESDAFTAYPALESGFISSLTVDKKDNLYVATSRSIFYYDPAMSQTKAVNADFFSDFLTGSDDIVPLLFDSCGNLWIGRNGNGVMRVNLGNGTREVFAAGQISDGTVRTITEDSGHRIWLGTEKGITVIHPNGSAEIIRHSLSQENLLSDNAIYAVLHDSRGRTWIGSYFGGVDVLAENNSGFTCFAPGSQPQNIKARIPRAIVEVSSGIYWIATEDGGINIYDSAKGVFTRFDKIPEVGTNVHSLYYDRLSGDIWIGTFRNGLFRYNLKSHRRQRYSAADGLPSSSIFSIARSKDGRMWIATTAGLRLYDTESDTFVKTGDATLDAVFSYVLQTDEDNNLWVGTVHNGLFRVDGRTKRATQWRSENQPTTLKDNYITALYQDREGVLWIGTNNNGLQYIDTKTLKIHSVTDNVFPQNCTVCSICADKAGVLCIGTNKGLYFYSPKTNKAAFFNAADGLPTNQFNFSSSLLTDGGTVLMGTVNGLVAVNPDKFGKRQQSLRVHLNSLVINGREVAATSPASPLTDKLDNTATIKLSDSDARSFSLSYGVISPAATNNIKYRVLLEGLDKNWREVGAERTFSVNNIPAGTYRLRIRANNSDDNWEACPEKVLEIIVKPPFYLSLWAYIVYAVLAAAVFYAVWRVLQTRLREKKEVERANMEKNKVEELDRERTEFFSMVSHELKTPLSLIVAPLHNISQKELDGETHKYIDTALKNTRKMSTLIDELLAINKIESNNFPFYLQQGNPMAFISRLLTLYQDTATARSITLTDACEDNGEDVWFSTAYVERIVENLVSNALKFTREGGSIAVRARLVEEETAPAMFLHIEVADNGIGIAKEEQANIFKKYYQTKRGYNVNNTGWGLGLSLVKRLAEIHKGDISVESEIGKGSTFSVNLNVDSRSFEPSCLLQGNKVIVPADEYRFNALDPDAGDNAHGMPASQPLKEKLSILLVEDNVDMMAFLRDYFAKQYNIFTAGNGIEAVDVVRHNPIQLIISDVMMPQMDGIQLCRTLKEDIATSHIPIVLLTAKSDSRDVVAGYECGAEAYVPKPFDPVALELQVKNIIALNTERQKSLVEDGIEASEADNLNSLDKDFIERMNAVVNENLSNSDFSVQDIAQALAVSRSLLYVKMKNLMGISIGDYIRKKRIDMACGLLRDGYNVSETAYRSGFSDPNYFSKTFKKFVGCNPRDYTKAGQEGGS